MYIYVIAKRKLTYIWITLLQIREENRSTFRAFYRRQTNKNDTAKLRLRQNPRNTTDGLKSSTHLK